MRKDAPLFFLNTEKLNKQASQRKTHPLVAGVSSKTLHLAVSTLLSFQDEPETVFREIITSITKVIVFLKGLSTQIINSFG